MKYLISIILLSKVLYANALSFREVPLNKMIDKAEVIYIGQITEVQKTDSLLRNQLRNIIRSDNYEIGDPSCGYCSEIATFVISKSLKGQIQNDTIFIPFHSSIMFALPGFSENKEYILFLDELENFNFHLKSDPRFGVKSDHLVEYESLISKYLYLNSVSEKREWIIDLCINPRLSREGMFNFKYYRSRQFSELEKRVMIEGLNKMNFKTDKYLKLLERVQEFGENKVLVEKCFVRLAEIKEEKVYEGLDLMLAINELDPEPEYKRLIDDFRDGFNNKLSDSEKLELIRRFRNKRN